LLLLDPRTARVVFTILVIAAVLAFIYGARDTLIAFLFSVFFAYLVDPLVSNVQPWVKGSRGRAIAVVYLVFAAVLALLGYLLGSQLAGDFRHLTQTLPGMFERLASGEIAFTVGRQRGWSYETQVRVQSFLASHQQEILAWAKLYAGRLAVEAKRAWWLLLVPVLGIFFLKDGAKFAQGAIELLSRRKEREFVDAVLSDINAMLAHFIRAQLILAVLSAAVYTIVLLLLRLQYGVVLGVIGGMLEFIPVVGPLVAGIAIIFIAVLTAYKHLLALLIFLGGWRLIQDYVNSPRIMGRQTELHPLAALFGVLAGAEIAGVVGVYLSIPIMASLRIVWRHWRTYVDSAGVQLAGSGEPVSPGKTTS
jgi:predicted PurR-regulated permease PerM